VGLVLREALVFTAPDCGLEFFATSGLAAGVAGLVVPNQGPRRDSTETEKATAAKRATAAISIGAVERFDLVDLFDFEFLRKLRLRITRARL
jgi:hypothetical protein